MTPTYTPEQLLERGRISSQILDAALRFTRAQRVLEQLSPAEIDSDTWEGAAREREAALDLLDELSASYDGLS